MRKRWGLGNACDDADINLEHRYIDWTKVMIHRPRKPHGVKKNKIERGKVRRIDGIMKVTASSLRSIFDLVLRTRQRHIARAYERRSRWWKRKLGDSKLKVFRWVQSTCCKTCICANINHPSIHQSILCSSGPMSLRLLPLCQPLFSLSAKICGLPFEN